MKMEGKLSVEVKTMSSAMIKPSSPTPSHLKTYTLSLVDQIHPLYYTIMLLFYPKTSETTGPLDINVLKTSLSKTLSQFYPFAGRCKDAFTLSCNDEGIPFVETRVDCVLSDFLSLGKHKVEHLHKLTPPQEYMDENRVLSELAPVAVKVNVFSCGGVVIGCYKLHKLIDGTTLATFLKHWAANTQNESSSVKFEGYPQNRDPTLAAPDFDATISVFPPRPTMGWQPYEEHKAMAKQYEDVHVVVRSFVFTKHAINEIRVKAASEEVPKPTRVEALAGFVWLHCMAAAYTTGAMPLGPDPSVMSVVVSMRPRFEPSLPATSMGNLITSASARTEKETPLPELVRVIHAAVSNVNERIRSYSEDVDALVADVDAVIAYSPGLYGISSWTQFGLDKVDFGFGKPKWACPTDGKVVRFLRNFTYFVTDTNGDGIEAWLFLEEKEMLILESNKEFLAFATPN